MLRRESQIKSTDFYWAELKDLANDVKLELISRLSDSVASTLSSFDEREASTKRTQRFVDKFCGAWAGSESGDMILKDLRSSRFSRTNPIELD